MSTSLNDYKRGPSRVESSTAKPGKKRNSSNLKLQGDGRGKVRIVTKRIFKTEATSVLEALVDAQITLISILFYSIFMRQGSADAIYEQYLSRLSKRSLTTRGIIALVIQLIILCLAITYI